MKKFFLMLICGLLTVPLTAQAFRTHRVNNMLTANPTAKIYTTVQAAHDAANNGDTILIEGSPIAYSGFTVNKQLVIKGPGYFLDENQGLSANKLHALINSGSITFDAGSSGSLLMGIFHSTSVDLIAVLVDDITIRRCDIKSVIPSSMVRNLTISECYFSVGATYSAMAGKVSNIIVANCIFKNSVELADESTGTFINNIFTDVSIDLPTGIVMKNNIIFTTDKTYIHLPMLDAAVSYNMSISDHFGTANNNKANVSESALFVGALTESTDGKWQLKAGSPAAGAGEGGVDCGAFGGPNPYILSGLPVGPTIYELNVSSYATPAGKLPMTIKVKSH